MTDRPQRCQLPDFSGTLLTLSDAPQNWVCLSSPSHGKDILLCGLGPGKPETLPFLANARQIFWMDDPATIQAMRSAGYSPSPPTGWQEIAPVELSTYGKRCEVWFYRPNLRLAPDFWENILGGVESAHFHNHETGNQRPSCTKPSVILPGNNGQLLHPCLHGTLERMGFSPITDIPKIPSRQNMGAIWETVLGGVPPHLLLAVNGRGLDSEGYVFQFFRALGVPVAIWFVDNPWHVLSGWRIPWWKSANLFVTDKSFVAPLQATGARHVWPLPLAAAPHMLQFGKQSSDLSHNSAGPLFVGRSTFPQREQFFAAARVPQAILETALHRLEQSGTPADTPHFHWWCEQLRPKPWPSQEVRNAGYGAEQCALANRIRWIRSGLLAQMHIIGDEGWQKAFPAAQVAPPVDYYTSLPRHYTSAQCVLNVTSLLLPHSLSQRHFDVWAAGGFLLSDATQGLEIFPEELVSAIMVDHPDQLAEKISVLAAKPTLHADLKKSWQEHIRAHHTYVQRIQTILDLTAETT